MSRPVSWFTDLLTRKLPVFGVSVNKKRDNPDRVRLRLLPILIISSDCSFLRPMRRPGRVLSEP